MVVILWLLASTRAPCLFRVDCCMVARAGARLLAVFATAASFILPAARHYLSPSFAGMRRDAALRSAGSEARARHVAADATYALMRQAGFAAIRRAVAAMLAYVCVAAYDATLALYAAPFCFVARADRGLRALPPCYAALLYLMMTPAAPLMPRLPPRAPAAPSCRSAID